MGRETQCYALGQLVSHSPLPVTAEAVFAGTDPEAWMERIAQAILAYNYPRFLLDTSSFPTPLTQDLPPKIWEGLFGRGSKGERQALASFAPELGLASREDPFTFSPSSPLLDLLKDKLREMNGLWDAKELFRYLIHSQGLPRPLATLYLLCFVAQGVRSASLALRPGHGQRLRWGDPLEAEVVSPEVAPDLAWPQDTEGAFQGLCLTDPSSWKTSAPFLQQIVSALAPRSAPLEDADSILQLLGDLGLALQKQSHGLQELASALASPLATAAQSAFERLEALTHSNDPTDFYLQCQKRYRRLRELRDDLRLFQNARKVLTAAPQIVSSKIYLDSMQLGEKWRSLSLERTLLLEEFHLDSLLANPALWSSVYSHFQALQAKYTTAYLFHHTSYQKETTKLSHQLNEASDKVRALVLLNTLPELGQPLLPELPLQYHSLISTVKPCQAAKPDIELSQAPYCQGCGLSLDQEPPTAQVENLLRGTQSALAEHCRRLSSLAVRRILADSTQEPLRHFLQIVQASNSEALVKVMDQELVDFLRRWLRQGV